MATSRASASTSSPTAISAGAAPGSIPSAAVVRSMSAIRARPNATATLDPSVAATSARTSHHDPAIPASDPGAIEAPSATPTTACETTVGACGTSSAPPRVAATASPPSRPARSHGAGRPTAPAASPAATQASRGASPEAERAHGHAAHRGG
ncbi:MAG: hypothetical protein AVDCRST_MAG45-1620 [uncultured Solirubrobacterales bacterium]|uniref:Uncharacterized protein n=1 Tax=uncultured Solirubrobacterales bacterium TaxID=768556 RepID=A0A6J4SVK6_9ACTN|nr:MAG: hypothetical protein AVDCRST_MAG45-1620 [uncultured Solirubrobacterales bacterium]